MALIKELTLQTGRKLNYHRIESIQINVDGESADVRFACSVDKKERALNILPEYTTVRMKIADEDKKMLLGMAYQLAKKSNEFEASVLAEATDDL